MNVWLCPIKARGWRVVKKTKVFGASSHARKLMAQLSLNDLLIFHILKPVNGIVAIGRVVSDLYIDNSDLWGKDRYPIRVKIELIPDYLRSNENAIPLDVLFGSNPEDEFSVSPFLKNTWVAPVSQKQFENIKRVFKSTG